MGLVQFLIHLAGQAMYNDFSGLYIQVRVMLTL
jgi:hypothetical protein